MDVAYAAADLVVARAGAITCAELLATRTPSILIPSPNVAEDHQAENAAALAESGCATVLREEDLFPPEPRSGVSVMARAVAAALSDAEKLTAMAAAAAAADTPRAAREIADDVARVALR
jgi:UDP-N-acetylglucosamine--N-acetylmuramyl-(pentapeptide) pyrophosphoryl-undecaprenol N-acetylglucosamine transferase